MSVHVGLLIKTVVPLILFVGYLVYRDQLTQFRELPTGSGRWFVLAGVSSVGFLLAYYSGLRVSRVGGSGSDYANQSIACGSGIRGVSAGYRARDRTVSRGERDCGCGGRARDIARLNLIQTLFLGIYGY